MDEKPFEEPVLVRLEPLGPALPIHSTKKAVELLTDARWPSERGPRHRDAVDACLKVLDGHRSTLDARNALLEAAREAEILVAV
ncbi:hypothetical protein MesoLjLc_15870 [Mesorhizobium sp. L-8-10]|uniref:DUF982 domain-containing protein n=1 Tax=unclassified Mesorhizobium TaxID=325217 RepID=UPI001928A477|nr:MULTISPECIES: DUF982 domain-containing protein [unclassified Mesorhizobium]BCH21963.1 hypothetical protein MesoLjLb_17480 [Mesorhizobium sp. L-8-3]BCH29657.1 hypothetical protein MesoLjLc_15870 [Mesorhizobium sp. L-8-10]